MALLIGDIGGSSSRWAVITGGQGRLLPGTFPGYNPATGSPQALQAALAGEELAQAIGEEVGEVVAYGAGCGASTRAELLRSALAQAWPRAAITVESDLLGAARGLYGTEQGLALVLGTGMNAGHFEGTSLQAPMPSLGYILGDEGSGADIGKHVLRDALYGMAPAGLVETLFPQGIDLGAVLQGTYRSAAPQAYVASFTAALAQHADEAYVQELVASRFRALAHLLSRFFSAEQRQQVRASGSVALAFQGILGDVLAREGMQLAAVIKDPLPGLLALHAGAGR